MKKLFSLLLVTVILFSLAACTGINTDHGSNQNSSSPTVPSSTPTKSEGKSENNASEASKAPSDTSDDIMEPTDNDAKVLVAYFSATGTTKELAEYAADAMGADLYEIVPETPYTSNDLNYNDLNSRSTLEMNDSSSRPAINGGVEDMDSYDIVFLGYPIWWGEAPRIISTFIESYDFGGKTIVPFCTSGGSGLGSSARKLHSLCSDSAKWLDGDRLSSSSSRSDMVDWINNLGLDIEAK